MSITYPINALPRAIPLCLGVQSEYGARPISIDVSEWVGRWPDIIVSVQPVRPGEDVSYPAAGVTRSGNIVTWTPNAYDTEIPGTGSVEIIGLADGVKIIRTGAATTIALTKSSVSKTPEDPMAAWADSVIRAGEQAKAGAEEALLSAQAANKSANNANASAVQAQSAHRAAANAASQAATYRTDAVNAMNAAKNSQTQAKTSEQSASVSATAAYKSQTKAEAAAKRAEDAANSMGGGAVSPGYGKLKADAIICSVSGESVSISDASERDALSVVSHISAPDGVTGIKLTRTGRNIFGGMALVHSIVNQAVGSVLDMDAKTVTYNAPSIKGVNVFDKFEPGKRYTIIFRRDESASKGTTANIRIIYDNGDAENITFNSGNTAVVATAANKNVEKLLGYNFSGPTCLLYEQCGIFEGVLTETDFVPYEAETFTAALPETVTDGMFDWTTGVLTINQDGASRTVQLDAQPIAMRDMYNAMWSSTGQTDVRYVADTKAYVDGHGADADAEYADNAGYAEEAGDAQTVKGRDIAAEVDELYEEIASCKRVINRNVNFVGMSIWWYDGRTLGEGFGGGVAAKGYQSRIREQFAFRATNNYCYSGFSLSALSDADANSIMAAKAQSWTGASGDIWTLDTVTNDFKRNIPIGTVSDYANATGITTYYGALRAFADKVKELSGENAVVVCANALKRNNDGYTSTSENTAGATLLDYEYALMYVCALNGWHFIDQYRLSGITDETLAITTLDGLHLNNFGYGIASKPWIEQFGILAAVIAGNHAAPENPDVPVPDEPTYEIVTGQYVNKNGVFTDTATAGWRRTTMIPVTAGSVYVYYGTIPTAAAAGVVSAVYGYDSGKNAVMEIVGRVITSESGYAFVVPDGVAYIVCSSQHETVLNVEQAGSGWVNLELETSKRSMDADGQTSNSGNWRTSDYIPVASGNELRYIGTTKPGDVDIASMVGFDSSKATPTLLIDKEDCLSGKTVTVPDGVVFVRVCGFVGSDESTPLELSVYSD